MYTVSPQFRGAWMTLALILAAALPAAAQAQPGVSGGIGRAARPSVEDWVLANRQLRVLLRPDTLTISVEDLSTHETWGSDPWENSAGRVYLRGKNGEALTVGLGTAAQKNIEVLPASGAQAGPGLRISLSRFHSRMGPVREDRGVDGSLSLVLQIELAKDNPELTFRVLEMRNSSPYWRVETVEWPLRLFPVRAVDDDGYIVFPEEQGFIVPSRFEQGYFRYLNWVWERIAGFAFVAEQSSMPWFGARKGQSSFLAIVETPDDVAYGVIANDVRAPEQAAAPPSAVPGPATALSAPRLSAIWPYWRSVKGELGYPRVARYIFQPGGGYVEMCKTYRKYAQSTGKLVTLKQKIAANPEVAKLIGAPNFEINVLANRTRQPQYWNALRPDSGRRAPIADQLRADRSHGQRHARQPPPGPRRDPHSGLGRPRATTTTARSIRPRSTRRPAGRQSSRGPLRPLSRRVIWAGFGTTTGRWRSTLPATTRSISPAT